MWWKRRHRAELRARPLSEEALSVVRRVVHLYPYLPGADRRELEGNVRVFLEDKRFEGAGGLVVTEEMRVTVAAQACLLVLHRDDDVFDDLETIVLYPHTYVAHVERRDGPIVVAGPEARLGESWRAGLVVLAWDEVKRDARSLHSGHNVVLHELAHQLDAEDGAMDGAPRLESRKRYAAWAHVLGEAYHELGERLRAGASSDIDAYAATSPAEFFAVVTEEFFERADVLRARHPALYAELAAFYRLDPAALVAAGPRDEERPSHA